MYDVTVNYVEAHEEWLNWIETIIQNEEILEKIKREVESQLKLAENKLYNELEENFSEVTKAVQHKRGGYFLLHRMKNFVEDMIKAGHIEEKEAKFFLDHIEIEVRNLELNKLKINFEEADLDFQSHWKLAKIFSGDEIEEICSHFTEEIYDAGDAILKADQQLSKVYYISKGIVHEKMEILITLKHQKLWIELEIYLVFNSFLKNEGLSWTNWYAKTVCTVQVFDLDVLRRYIKVIDQEIRIWHYIGPSIIHLFSDKFSKLKDLDPLQLKILLKNSTYYSYEANQKCCLENGAILFEGELEEAELSELNQEEVTQSKRAGTIKAYSFIYPTNTTYIAKSTWKIFVLPESLRETWLYFDQRVFWDVFNIVSNSITSSKYRSITRKGKDSLRSAKSLLNIPKSLTHPNLVNIPENKNEKLKVPDHLLKMNLRDLEGQNTIMPKGYFKSRMQRNYDYSNDENDIVIPEITNPNKKIKESINSDSDSEGENESGDKRGPNPHGNKSGANIISKNQIENIEVEIPSFSHSKNNSEESMQNSEEE